MAERKHQCVASQKLSVETQLQKEPVVVFTHTVVYPKKKKKRRNTEPLVRCPHEDHEGKPQPKSQLFKTHIYSAFCKSQQPVRRERRWKRSSTFRPLARGSSVRRECAQRARRTSLCTPALP